MKIIADIDQVVFLLIGIALLLLLGTLVIEQFRKKPPR